MNTKRKTAGMFIFVLIVLLGIVLRGYNISSVSTIGYDQARDFLFVDRLISEKKITLIGPETNIGSRRIYFGPLHYYILGAQTYLAHGDTLIVYYSCVLLGIVSLFIFRIFNKSNSAVLLLSVFPLMIFPSRVPWNPNTIPLFSIISFGFFVRKRYLLSGLFFGFMFQLHYTSVLAGLFFFIPYYLIIVGDRKFVNIVKFLLGSILGILPIILFDFRHGFINTQSIFSINGSDAGTRTLGAYYFLWVAPAFAFLFSRYSKILLSISLISFFVSLKMLIMQEFNPSLTIRQVEAVSKVIATQENDSTLNYNVASLSDADTRATAYRYFLKRYNSTPLGVGEYSIADHVYVVTPNDKFKEALTSQTYEISSFHPKRISKVEKVGINYVIRMEYK